MVVLSSAVAILRRGDREKPRISQRGSAMRAGKLPTELLFFIIFGRARRLLSHRAHGLLGDRVGISALKCLGIQSRPRRPMLSRNSPAVSVMACASSNARCTPSGWTTATTSARRLPAYREPGLPYGSGRSCPWSAPSPQLARCPDIMCRAMVLAENQVRDGSCIRPDTQGIKAGVARHRQELPPEAAQQNVIACHYRARTGLYQRTGDLDGGVVAHLWHELQESGSGKPVGRAGSCCTSLRR